MTTEDALLRFFRCQCQYLPSPHQRRNQDGRMNREYRVLSATMMSAVSAFEDAIDIPTSSVFHFFVFNLMHDRFEEFKWYSCFNAFDKHGCTPLMTAASRAHWYPEEAFLAVGKLIALGSVKHLETEQGQTALGAYYEAMSTQAFQMEFGYPLVIADDRIVALLMPEHGLTKEDKKHKKAYESMLKKRKRED